jgi:beta-galactosidase
VLQRSKCVAACLLLGLTFAPRAKAEPERIKETIDRGWKFFLGDDAKASDPKFDDRKWQEVNLPHSFSEPYFRSPDFYIGYGWYRRHIAMNAAALKRRESLEFEGVFQIAEVWVNGVKVGSHEGGYTGFSLDVSKVMKVGDNVISVRVNNLWNAQLNPRAGEHVFSGGIYRDVYFVETAPTHVMWYGTFVTTPKVSNDAATVNVKTEIANDSNEAETAKLQTTIMDPQGKTVAEYSDESQIMVSRETVDVYGSEPRVCERKIAGLVSNALRYPVVYVDSRRWPYVQRQA